MCMDNIPAEARTACLHIPQRLPAAVPLYKGNLDCVASNGMMWNSAYWYAPCGPKTHLARSGSCWHTPGWDIAAQFTTASKGPWWSNTCCVSWPEARSHRTCWTFAKPSSSGCSDRHNETTCTYLALVSRILRGNAALHGNTRTIAGPVFQRRNS